MSAVVEVRGLCNRFRFQQVHEGLDLDLARGEILGVVGGSGTGKSVLLRSSVGLNRPQAGVAVMGPQEAVAQAVEGADPHPPGVDREHRRQPREHFLGGLVGEGHRQDALGAAVAVLDQPGDPRGEHPRLARAGAGEDQGMLGRQRHGGELFRVEVVEELGHGAGEVDKCTAEPGIVPPGTTAGTPVDGCRNRSRSRNTGLQSRTL